MRKEQKEELKVKKAELLVAMGDTMSIMELDESSDSLEIGIEWKKEPRKDDKESESSKDKESGPSKDKGQGGKGGKSSQSSHSKGGNSSQSSNAKGGNSDGRHEGSSNTVKTTGEQIVIKN